LFDLSFFLSFPNLFFNKIKKYNNVITTNIPRHPYRTRANGKKMEKFHEAQESMKADVDQLKNQMSQMFEMMVALKDAIVARNEEAQSSQQGTVQTRNPMGIEQVRSSLHMVYL